MFCIKCGVEVPVGANYCPRCGAFVGSFSTPRTSEAEYVAPKPLPSLEASRSTSEIAILALGILSFVLGGLPGLIFAVICGVIVRIYTKKYGELPLKARIGNYLSLIAFVAGVIVVSAVVAVVLYALLTALLLVFLLIASVFLSAIAQMLGMSI